MGWKSIFQFSWLSTKEEGGSEKAKRYEEKLQKKYGLLSGTCERPDGLASAGWATMRGKREMNEDTLYCQWHHHEERLHVGAFGVFDGHGGPAASKFVRDNLFRNLLDHEQFERNPGKAVEDAYMETDSQYCDLCQKRQQDDGTTAVTAVLLDRRLVVAHVGDSRAVLSSGTSAALQLSVDHKPAREDERGRIEGAGGAVVWAGTWRVGGVLAVSRSFGNRMMKQFIIPHPEICDLKLEPRNEVLILASDGLWDAMGNVEACRMALANRSAGAEAAAKALIQEAYVRGSCDNITAVVVFFSFPADSS